MHVMRAAGTSQPSATSSVSQSPRTKSGFRPLVILARAASRSGALRRVAPLCLEEQRCCAGRPSPSRSAITYSGDSGKGSIPVRCAAPRCATVLGGAAVLCRAAFSLPQRHHILHAVLQQTKAALICTSGCKHASLFHTAGRRGYRARSGICLAELLRPQAGRSAGQAGGQHSHQHARAGRAEVQHKVPHLLCQGDGAVAGGARLTAALVCLTDQSQSPGVLASQVCAWSSGAARESFCSQAHASCIQALSSCTSLIIKLCHADATCSSKSRI